VPFETTINYSVSTRVFGWEAKRAHARGKYHCACLPRVQALRAWFGHRAIITEAEYDIRRDISVRVEIYLHFPLFDLGVGARWCSG